MLPYALCSNPRCSYSIELHARINGRSIQTPNYPCEAITPTMFSSGLASIVNHTSLVQLE